MEINALIIRSIEAQANSLLDLAHRDSNDYQRAVELILGMSGKLVFTGMGRVELLHESLPQHFPVQEYRRFSFILVRLTMAI